MHHIVKWAAPVLSALAVGSAFAQAPAPVTAAAPTAAEFIKADQPGVLAGRKRVAIATFTLQLVRDQGIERSAGSFGMFQGQSATYFTQTRVDPATLQGVADRLYDTFVAELKAGGVDVVPQAELDADPDYQELRKIAVASPFSDTLNTGRGRDQVMGVNVLTAAKGLPIITNGLQDKKWFPTQTEGYGSLIKVVLGSATTAKTLQAPLLHVKLALSMVEIKGRGWGGSSQFGNLTVKSASWNFDADPLPRFVEGGTAVLVAGADLGGQPSARGLLTLAKAIPVTGLELAASAGEGGNSRGSGLLGALARAANGTNTTAADAYLDVEPANFSDRVAGSAGQVLRLFVQAMTTR
jgi:hypothetical protein